jgi:hypothetical protein
MFSFEGAGSPDSKHHCRNTHECTCVLVLRRVAISILTIGVLFGLYEFGPPLYWRFYSTVIHPFEHGTAPASDEAPGQEDNAFDILLDNKAPPRG